MRGDPPVTYGASPLCEKGPLNSVYLCGFKVYLPICRAGARRVKRIVRWTIRSQSGEQFIIATGNCSRRRSIRTAEDVCPYSIEYFRFGIYIWLL